MTAHNEPFFFISSVRNPLSACPPSSRVSPFCLWQSPAGRATLGSRTLSDVASLCHLSLWCKKNRAHQRLRTNSGARRSLPRRRCSSRSVTQQVSACIRTQRIGKYKKRDIAMHSAKDTLRTDRRVLAVREGWARRV